MDHIYTDSLQAVDIEPQLKPKPKRWQKIVASAGALISLGGAIGVAADSELNTPAKMWAASPANELSHKWDKLKLIQTARAQTKWLKHVNQENLRSGLTFSQALANFAVEVTASHNSYTLPSTSSSSVSGSSYNGNVEEFLACTRAIESDSAGGYQAVSAGGTYRGAYQFDRQTWDSTAANNGRPDLVGKDPAQVAPADQDQMATELYEERGNQPWGGRC